MNDVRLKQILTALTYGLYAGMAIVLFAMYIGWLPLGWGVLLLVGLFGLFVWYVPTNYFFQRGMRSFKRNAFEQAIPQFTQSYLANKKSVRSLDRRAHCFAELRDYAGALADADEAIRIKPKFYEPYMVRTYIYCKMDDFQNALIDAVLAVKLKPKSAFPLNVRGIVYILLAQYDLALQDLNETLRRKPKLAAGYSNRGMAYLRTGNATAALADFEKAMQLNPKMSQAYHNRGEYHLLQQNYPAALADFQAANNLNPQSDHALAGLALTHFLMGNHAPAKNFWRLLIGRDLSYADADWAIRHLRFPTELDVPLREFVNPS